MQRRGREFWTEVVNRYEATSGETNAEFAARHRVQKSRLERWLYLRRDERSEVGGRNRMRLLPVQVAVGYGEQHALVEMGGSLGLRVTVGPGCTGEPRLSPNGYVAAMVRGPHCQMDFRGGGVRQVFRSSNVWYQ